MFLTLSSDTGIESLDDVLECSRLSVQYFKTADDPAQIRVTRENSEWIYNNMPESLNIIKDKRRVIGWSFVLPSTHAQMMRFLGKELNEAQLFAEVQKSYVPTTPEAIYLCAALVLPECRGRGLATDALTRSIRALAEETHPALFYWAFTPEGDALANRVSSYMGFKLLKRDKA